jgi:hypothetical protein
MELTELVGKILKQVTQTSEKLTFEFTNGERYLFHHEQDCCENVTIESVSGDWSRLYGSPLLRAEEKQSKDEQIDGKPEYIDSCTWTFYTFATQLDTVDVRWLGESNGYYSESVSLCKL